MNMKFVKLMFAIAFAALAFVFYFAHNNAQAKSKSEPTVETIPLSNSYVSSIVYKIIDGEYTCYLYIGSKSSTMQCVPTRN